MSTPFSTNNPGIGGLDELTAAEEALIAGIANYGTAGQLLAVNGTEDGVEWVDPSASSGEVTAASNFGADNSVIRSDGTLKGIQASGLTISDTDDLSGVATLTIDASGSLIFGAVTIISDSAGTTTLSNIDAIDATTLATIKSAGNFIDGTGVATYVPFFSDTDTLTTDAHFYYNSTTDILHVHGIAGDATDGLLIESEGGTDIGILGAANTANATWYGSHNFNVVTASRVAQFSASKTLESSSVTTTELGYLSGVTSAIQTQLNTKVTGPASATDNALVRFDSTTGKLVQNSPATLTDSGDLEITGTGADLFFGYYNSEDDTFSFNLGSGQAYISLSAPGVGAANLGETGLTITSYSAGATGNYVRLYQDSATPAPSDVVGLLYFTGEDSAGNQQDYSAIKGIISSPTTTAEAGYLVFSVTTGGTLTDKLELSSGYLAPSASDGLSLGASALMWSDLFLASGSVINFNNGDVTVTHSSNKITVDGGSIEGRIAKRVGSTTSSATPTINTDIYDEYHLTAQAADITSFTTNLSGTPVAGDSLFISVTGTAARAITWGASFENGPVALPTTTVTTTRLDVLFKWNTVTSKWRCMASGSTV